MPQSCSSRGFTLVEVLVSLALIAVLIAGAASLMARATMLIRSARVNTTATLLAVQKVEQIRSAPGTFPAGTQQDYLAADSTASPEASAFFIRRWTIVSGWEAAGSSSVLVEVMAIGVGRVAALQAVV